MTNLPVNYTALKLISWLTADVQNSQSLTSTIFGISWDQNDPKFLELVKAAINAIMETEDDLAELKKLLTPLLTPLIS